MGPYHVLPVMHQMGGRTSGTIFVCFREDIPFYLGDHPMTWIRGFHNHGVIFSFPQRISSWDPLPNGINDSSKAVQTYQLG